jgi:uncharacterized iron-regulated membrane protein
VSGIYFAWPEPFVATVEWIWGPAEDRNYELSLGDEIIRWVVRLHFGRWPSKTLQAVWVVMGLVPAVMLITGAAMWWYRVIRKRALVEEINGVMPLQQAQHVE